MRTVPPSPLRCLSTRARRWLLALALASATGAVQADDPKAARFYEDALVRYEKNDIAGAIIQLKNALQIDKNLLPVELLVGKALLAQSEVFAAEVAFNEALRLGVNRGEVVLDLARAVIDQGRPQEVLEQARFGLDGLPRDLRYELLLLRAAAASDLGDHKAALLQLFEQAVDVLGMFAVVEQNLGQFHLVDVQAGVVAVGRAGQVPEHAVE